MADILWHVADQAYPTDPALMPKDVRVVLGYVGEVNMTPHLWTMAEVANVRDHGKLWAPIHTVPPSWVWSGAGHDAASLMLDELKRYAYPGDGPVFLDVEHRTYAENPSAVLHQVEQWRWDMIKAGHSQALAYLPWAANRQWVANWTGVRPATLPAGLAGWQYEQAVHGRGYDLSVFRASVFDALTTKGTTVTSSLTTTDKTWITAQLVKVRDQVLTVLGAEHSDSDPAHPHPAANVHLLAQLKDIHDTVAGLKAGPVNVDDLAARLATQLGPDLGRQLVTALGAKLAP